MDTAVQMQMCEWMYVRACRVVEDASVSAVVQMFGKLLVLCRGSVAQRKERESG